MRHWPRKPESHVIERSRSRADSRSTSIVGAIARFGSRARPISRRSESDPSPRSIVCDPLRGSRSAADKHADYNLPRRSRRTRGSPGRAPLLARTLAPSFVAPGDRRMRAIYVNSGHWPPAGMRAAGDPLPARQCQAERRAARSNYRANLSSMGTKRRRRKTDDFCRDARATRGRIVNTSGYSDFLPRMRSPDEISASGIDPFQSRKAFDLDKVEETKISTKISEGEHRE